MRRKIEFPAANSPPPEFALIFAAKAESHNYVPLCVRHEQSVIEYRRPRRPAEVIGYLKRNFPVLLERNDSPQRRIGHKEHPAALGNGHRTTQPNLPNLR